MVEPSVPSPLGTDGQYELLYRSFLNSETRVKEMFAELSQTLTLIRADINKLAPVHNPSSRIPGGRLIHKLFQRLARRQLDPTVNALKRIELGLTDAMQKMAEVWDATYRNEFEMERRSRSGVLDRLAIVDALQLRIELLEEDLAKLRTSN